MDDDPNIPPPRQLLAPPDPAYVYTSPLERFAGAAVDIIFLHIILIPLRAPAADWSFRQASVWPAALFTLAYFLLLLILLRLHGLTPGGIPLKYRVVRFDMGILGWGQGLRRLAPYVIIHLVGLWRLHVVLQSFHASGEEYAFDQVLEIIATHGGLWNVLVMALNAFVVIDLMMVLPSPRNQSLTDKLACSVVVSRSPSP